MADGNKSEQATQRRREKAREQGQVLRSRELSGSVAWLAGVMLLSSLIPHMAGAWLGIYPHELDLATHSDLSLRTPLFPPAAWMLLTGVGGLMGALWLAALFSSLAQGGVVVAPSLLSLKVERLSPATKLKQLFSMSGLSSLLKSLLPTTLLVYLAVQMVIRDWHLVLMSARLEPRPLLGWVMSRSFEIAWKSALVMLGWSGVDYLLQRQHFESGLMMSKQEIREESKESDGNPIIKARIRRLQRQMRRRHMLQDVKQATVVITNPHEYAIALAYTPEMEAPTVVAKGRNRLAQEIKQTALWQGIPLVENKPLAHTLYRAVEVGQTIPAKLYAVVAEILAAIFRAQARATGGR